VTQAYQQDEADDAALGSRRGDELPAELAPVRSAWRRLSGHEAVGDAGQAEAQPSVSAEPTQKRSSTDGKTRRGKARNQWERLPPTRRRVSLRIPHCISCAPTKGLGLLGNAQARVDATCQIILACDVTDASNDKQQLSLWPKRRCPSWPRAGLARPTNESGTAQAISVTLDNG